MSSGPQNVVGLNGKDTAIFKHGFLLHFCQRRREKLHIFATLDECPFVLVQKVIGHSRDGGTAEFVGGSLANDHLFYGTHKCNRWKSY